MNFKFLITYFTFIILFSTFSNAEDKIVFVDTNKVINASLAGQSITKQLKILDEKNIENFTKIEKEFKTEETKLLAQKNVLDEDQYIKKVNEFKKKVNLHNENKKKTNSIFNKKKFEAEKNLLLILKKILSDYSKKNSITLIISKKSVIIGKKELDITESIIEDLNLEIKEIKIN
jgi:outer membrane protein